MYILTIHGIAFQNINLSINIYEPDKKSISLMMQHAFDNDRIFSLRFPTSKKFSISIKIEQTSINTLLEKCADIVPFKKSLAIKGCLCLN